MKGSISSSPCTAVRWVPSSSTLFLVSHADGTIIVYDKDREDGSFTPQDPNSPIVDGNNPLSSVGDGTPQEWDPLDNILVTMPPWHPITSGANALNASGKAEKEKAAKNPVSHWRVSRQSVVGELCVVGMISCSWTYTCRIDFVFSFDVKYVAAISEDGCLRVIDALAEQ